MLTKGAYIVCGKLLALVNVAAYLTAIAYLLCGLGLGLYVCVVVGIGDAFGLGEVFCLNNLCLKEGVRAHIFSAHNLKGEVGVYVFGKVEDAVLGSL